MRKRTSLWRKKGDIEIWKIADSEVWKKTKVTKPIKQRWESGRTKALQQNAKLKQQKAAPKRAEKTTMAALKCATEKKFRRLCRTKSLDVDYFKEKQTEEQQTLELPTFCPEASSFGEIEASTGNRMDLWRKNVAAKYEKELTSKCDKYESDKTQ